MHFSEPINIPQYISDQFLILEQKSQIHGPHFDKHVYLLEHQR